MEATPLLPLRRRRKEVGKEKSKSNEKITNPQVFFQEHIQNLIKGYGTAKIAQIKVENKIINLFYPIPQIGPDYSK